jgi:hypothetical protein
MADNHPYPAGEQALHPDWPEAMFTVSGVFNYHQVVLAFRKIVEDTFGCRAPIESLHGAPPVLWNGGRMPIASYGPEDFPKVLDSINALGVGCLLTFSNHRLEAQDLEDRTCNYLLDAVAAKPELNGVIVASDLLSDYIARRHPGLRQVASIIRTVVDGGRGNASYYRELGKRFHRYVIHPDDGFNLAMLDQLDRDKTEILVNEYCLQDCPNRPRHVDLVAQWQRAFAHSVSVDPSAAGAAEARAEYQRAKQELDELLTDCMLMPPTRQIDNRQRNCNFTREEMKAVYDLGFRHFKLQGRRDPIYSFVYDLSHYMLEPGVAAPLVFKVLFWKIVNEGQKPQSLSR